MNHPDEKRSKRGLRLLQPWPYVAAMGIFVFYSVWIGWPYLHSVLVRDAAVTTWSHLATAPINGTVTFDIATINAPVGRDGVVATIRNAHASTEAVDAAQLAVARAKAKREKARELLANIRELNDDRRALKAEYAKLFRAQLDADIAQYENELSAMETRLESIRKIADRKGQLAQRGATAVSTVDEVSLRNSQIQREMEQLRGALSRVRTRRAAADQGVFIDADGEDPSWVQATRIPLKIKKEEARFELNQASAELENAESDLERARANYQRESLATISGRPGRLLWHRIAAPGMAVEAGAPIAQLVDCDDLLVDMPISDAVASLVSIGQPATVTVEGEARLRSAEVLLVRGAASKLSDKELVALAKGRKSEDATLLLRLHASAADFGTCPVGRSAYVHFPDIGLIDVVRARLRL